MKRKLKIEASFSGVLPTGSYSNMRPGFLARMEYEAEFANDKELHFAIEAAQQELQGICYQSFEAEATKAKILKIQEDLKNFRFYEAESGEKFPSVTSINGYDKDWFVGDEDLKVYAAQGNIIDAEIRNYAKTGVYKQSKDLLECTADRFILKSRALSSGKMLSLEGWNFLGFLEKYPITELRSVEEPVFNKRYKYAGTPDLLGVHQGLKTLISIKRTKSELDNLIQESAYANCEGMEDIKQMMVVEMKSEADGGNKCGYSKPIVSLEIEKYFELFLRKRSEFAKIYGI